MEAFVIKQADGGKFLTKAGWGAERDAVRFLTPEEAHEAIATLDDSGEEEPDKDNGKGSKRK